MFWSRSNLVAVKYKETTPRSINGFTMPWSTNLQIIFSFNWSINLLIFQILDFLLGRNLSEENTWLWLNYTDLTLIYFCSLQTGLGPIKINSGLIFKLQWKHSSNTGLSHQEYQELSLRAPSGISHYIEYSPFLNGCQYLTVTLLTATILCIQPSQPSYNMMKQKFLSHNRMPFYPSRKISEIFQPNSDRVRNQFCFSTLYFPNELKFQWWTIFQYLDLMGFLQNFAPI